MSEQKLEGIIFGIQRFSIHDGPGIRTTVFLKGCNMHCKWCHNPESYRPAPVLAYNPALCVGCRACAAACPNGVHNFDTGEHSLQREKCVVCGQCVSACPRKALEIIGSKSDPDHLMTQIRKDRRYYASSGGGVTLSGGEALMQFDFALEILKRCKEEGIHTVIETNGTMPFERYRQALPYIDLFLMDYKLTDDEKHKEYTGLGRERILENIGRLHDEGAKILLRCPIIPGVNDDDGHFAAIAELTRRYPNLLGAELLAYHNLGVSKADRIGMEYEQFEVPQAGTLDKWKQRVRDFDGRIFEKYEKK